MKTDVVLRSDGMRILAQHLGIVEAERFVTLIKRDPFDYTQWRQGLFQGVSLDDFLERAKDYSENHEPARPK
ncbi:MAG: hypothetical protein ACRC2T_08435 [Thermoguttaceae bacterium]